MISCSQPKIDTNFDSGFKVGDMLTKTPSTYTAKTMGREGTDRMFTGNENIKRRRLLSFLGLQNHANAASSVGYVKIDMGRFARKTRLRNAASKKQVSTVDVQLNRLFRTVHSLFAYRSYHAKMKKLFEHTPSFEVISPTMPALSVLLER